MVGVEKTAALATQLNRLQPDAKVKDINWVFPTISSNGLEVAADYDIILDCTAENRLLRSLSHIPGSQKNCSYRFR